MTERFFSRAAFAQWFGQYSSFLLRLGIVVAVLAVSAQLASRASTANLMLIVGAGAFLVLLRFPLLGLIALPAAALVVPFSIGTGSQTPINIAVVTVAGVTAVWIADMVRRRKLQLAPSRTTRPLLAFVGATLISFLAAGLPWNAFAHPASIATQGGALGIFVLSAAVFLLVGNMVRQERVLMLLTAMFLGISGLYMLGRLFSPLAPLSNSMNASGSDGSLFWVWTIALASGQLLFNRKLNPVVQLALLALIGLTFYVAWFQGRSWTSGWLPPLVAFGTILWLRSWRLGVLAGVAGAVAVFFVYPDIVTRLLGTEAYSLSTRDAALQVLVTQVFPLSPLFGLGPANYYWYTPLYPILGWYVNFNSHNNYVDILLQTGLLGMACFLWFVARVGLLGWQLRTRFHANFAQAYVYGCLGGLAGTLVASWLADWLLPFVYNIGLNGFRASLFAWLFLGGLVSLENMQARGGASFHTHRMEEFDDG